jgi:hypothetical protein
MVSINDLYKHVYQRIRAELEASLVPGSWFPPLDSVEAEARTLLLRQIPISPPVPGP